MPARDQIPNESGVGVGVKLQDVPQLFHFQAEVSNVTAPVRRPLGGSAGRRCRHWAGHGGARFACMTVHALLVSSSAECTFRNTAAKARTSVCDPACAGSSPSPTACFPGDRQPVEGVAGEAASRRLAVSTSISRTAPAALRSGSPDGQVAVNFPASTSSGSAVAIASTRRAEVRSLCTADWSAGNFSDLPRSQGLFQRVRFPLFIYPISSSFHHRSAREPGIAGRVVTAMPGLPRKM